MFFGGNATKLNVGARFKNRLFYTILGGGTHYLDFGDKFSAASSTVPVLNYRSTNSCSSAEIWDTNI